MSTSCSICGQQFNFVDSSVKCDSCGIAKHLTCLNIKIDMQLKGDHMFDYECADCNQEHIEKCTRASLSWVQIIQLVLYNLNLKSSGRKGFFRWRDDICQMIEHYFNYLLPNHTKSNTWRGTVAGTLSAYCPNVFQTGNQIFEETGWWALAEVRPPIKSAASENLKRKKKEKYNPLGDILTKQIAKEPDAYGRGKRARKPAPSRTIEDITIITSKRVKSETKANKLENRVTIQTDAQQDRKTVTIPVATGPKQLGASLSLSCMTSGNILKEDTKDANIDQYNFGQSVNATNNSQKAINSIDIHRLKQDQLFASSSFQTATPKQQILSSSLISANNKQHTISSTSNIAQTNAQKAINAINQLRIKQQQAWSTISATATESSTQSNAQKAINSINQLRQRYNEHQKPLSVSSIPETPIVTHTPTSNTSNKQLINSTGQHHILVSNQQLLNTQAKSQSTNKNNLNISFKSSSKIFSPSITLPITETTNNDSFVISGKVNKSLLGNDNRDSIVPLKIIIKGQSGNAVATRYGIEDKPVSIKAMMAARNMSNLVGNFHTVNISTSKSNSDTSNSINNNINASVNNTNSVVNILTNTSGSAVTSSGGNVIINCNNSLINSTSSNVINNASIIDSNSMRKSNNVSSCITTTSLNVPSTNSTNASVTSGYATAKTCSFNIIGNAVLKGPNDNLILPNVIGNNATTNLGNASKSSSFESKVIKSPSVTVSATGTIMASHCDVTSVTNVIGSVMGTGNIIGTNASSTNVMSSKQMLKVMPASQQHQKLLQQYHQINKLRSAPPASSSVLSSNKRPIPIKQEQHDGYECTTSAPAGNLKKSNVKNLSLAHPNFAQKIFPNVSIAHSPLNQQKINTLNQQQILKRAASLSTAGNINGLGAGRSISKNLQPHRGSPLGHGKTSTIIRGRPKNQIYKQATQDSPRTVQISPRAMQKSPGHPQAQVTAGASPQMNTDTLKTSPKIESFQQPFTSNKSSFQQPNIPTYQQPLKSTNHSAQSPQQEIKKAKVIYSGRVSKQLHVSKQQRSFTTKKSSKQPCNNNVPSTNRKSTSMIELGDIVHEDTSIHQVMGPGHALLNSDAGNRSSQEYLCDCPPVFKFDHQCVDSDESSNDSSGGLISIRNEKNFTIMHSPQRENPNSLDNIIPNLPHREESQHISPSKCHTILQTSPKSFTTTNSCMKTDGLTTPPKKQVFSNNLHTNSLDEYSADLDDIKELVLPQRVDDLLIKSETVDDSFNLFNGEGVPSDGLFLDDEMGDDPFTGTSFSELIANEVTIPFREKVLPSDISNSSLSEVNTLESVCKSELESYDTPYETPMDTPITSRPNTPPQTPFDSPIGSPITSQPSSPQPSDIESWNPEELGLTVDPSTSCPRASTQDNPFVTRLQFSRFKREEAARNMFSLSLDDELDIVNKLNNCPNVLQSDPALNRLRRKLLVRKAKKENGVPCFDLDQQVTENLLNTAPDALEMRPKVRFSMATRIIDNDIKSEANNDSDAKTASTNTSSAVNNIQDPYHHPALRGVYVLDRFLFLQQSPRMKLFQNNNRYISFLSRLIGSQPDNENNRRPITSPYTSRVLKPFILRDFESLPLKLKLFRELRLVVALWNKKRDPNNPLLPPQTNHYSIDYCYAQPHHIPAVNYMLNEFFWPGIDISEALQYPEFTCIVLYRKLLIGFAFMVPDVKLNEAYISFILVHPDFRRAGIGTFMIYHLVQTCMGKDITLHVSPTNSAMMLYQRMGFKAEELILDFYDKYLPENSQDCKHAFLMRLQR